MLTTWHTVPLEKEQSQVTLFENNSSVGSSHPDCLVHGSTSKFQFVFPNVLAMSRKACTAKVSKSTQVIKSATLIKQANCQVEKEIQRLINPSKFARFQMKVLELIAWITMIYSGT
jgi:hypothetical protein